MLIDMTLNDLLNLTHCPESGSSTAIPSKSVKICENNASNNYIVIK